MIIVAGGSGTRMKSDIPKQFILLAGKPILMHTLEAFYKADTGINIIVVLPENQIGFWNELKEEHNFSIPHKVVEGGEERFYSVKNGLNSLKREEGLVGIHDGVRPIISKQVIDSAYELAVEKGNATVAVPSKDSLRKLTSQGNEAVLRSDFMLIQTPQVFELKAIQNAFSQGYSPEFTDDASVFEAAGHTIHLSEGSYSNIKVTTPEDLSIAEVLMKNM